MSTSSQLNNSFLDELELTEDDKMKLADTIEFSYEELKKLATMESFVDLQLNNVCYRFEERAKKTLGKRNMELTREEFDRIYVIFKKKKFHDYYHNYYLKNEKQLALMREDMIKERKFLSLYYLTINEEPASPQRTEHSHTETDSRTNSFDTVIDTQSMTTNLPVLNPVFAMDYEANDSSSSESTEEFQCNPARHIQSQGVVTYSQFENGGDVVTSTQQPTYEIIDSGTTSIHS